ncbi:hypothetical protein [Pontibacter sp. H249]|uniref:hypothetical protein n=1 Tax=Pontibacter sp. H249 TaxID=3133420 RepID=UPI0030BAFB86
MAKYIEFVGVPGVGKTTTYDALKARWSDSENWVPYELLGSEETLYKQGVREQLILYLVKLIKPQLLSRLTKKRTAIEQPFRISPELLELFWQNIAKSKHATGEDLRFYGVNYIRSIFEKIQHVLEEPTHKFCIIDEGLIHNLNYFLKNTQSYNLNQEVEKALDLIDLPAAIIYFEGDVTTVVDRTVQRGNFRIRDKSLTAEQLVKSREEALCEKNIYIEVIREKGIPVLTLNAADSVYEKVNKIKDFIYSLS